ncbi:hypothetical protein PG991_004778 [Apiospora marii]|uniref:Uncharacterized protein n=1 Tax=Apiospora marii TaxID=335849 RepID=A0ABR1S7B0_9PEZI
MHAAAGSWSWIWPPAQNQNYRTSPPAPPPQERNDKNKQKCPVVCGVYAKLPSGLDVKRDLHPSRIGVELDEVSRFVFDWSRASRDVQVIAQLAGVAKP